MSPEQRSDIPCLFARFKVCKCPWLPQNVAMLNSFGRRKLERREIEREGFRASPGLARRLLVEPEKGFAGKPFTPTMLGTGNYFHFVRKKAFLTYLETDPSNIKCHVLQFDIRSLDIDPAIYLAYLQSTLYERRHAE